MTQIRHAVSSNEAAISFGAAAGALLRWQLGVRMNSILPMLPLGTLAANLVGGYIVGSLNANQVTTTLVAGGLQGAMFAFINARRNKLKILVWERNGFILWYKRLERHRFHWPRVGEAVLTLSGVELNRLLDGYDVWMKPHEALHCSVLG